MSYQNKTVIVTGKLRSSHTYFFGMLAAANLVLSLGDLVNGFVSTVPYAYTLRAGSAAGLGKAIGTAFAQAGANTVLCDVNGAQLESTADEVRKAKVSGEIAAVRGDITSETSFAAVIDTAKKLGGGRLDVLVNCAGVMDRMEPAGECDLETWNRVIGINLTGTFLATKLTVTSMLAQEPSGGVILNIGSAAGIKGGIAGAAYTASKHGILGLTKNTAAFYAKKGIRCNALLPGGMQTEILSRMPGGMESIKKENWAVIASNSAWQPPLSDLDDVSKLVLAMCGEQGVVLNGACVPADNGWVAT